MNPFDDPSMAAGYARARPTLHPQIVGKLRRILPGPVRSAVDIGCGAGLSAAPLTAFCESVLGVDPAARMLPWARQTAPQANFAAARAEALPLPGSCTDLVTAAGSLNYVKDLPAAFAEVRRVLRPGGVLAVYDFSAGRTFADSQALTLWFEEFRRRYPVPVSQAIPISPTLLRTLDSGMEAVWSEPLLLELEMTRAGYAEYMLTETNVAHAVRLGEPLSRIREWTLSSLDGVFGELPHTVRFDAYLSCLRKNS